MGVGDGGFQMAQITRTERERRIRFHDHLYAFRRRIEAQAAEGVVNPLDIDQLVDEELSRARVRFMG